ncbi:MAG: SulP family inorganic anion transporter [Vicinamibacterales bacterium]
MAEQNVTSSSSGPTNTSFEAWLPKSVIALRTYSLQKLSADIIAGITVGLVALPLAMAFAISSGLTPQAGIYCAIVTGFLISALGGSQTQIGGPTGAFVVVVFGIVQEHGIDGLFMCTMMAGVMLVAIGAAGLGTAVRFIPRPVVIGFTNGIAILIASTQIKDFFGLQLAEVPGEFLERMKALAEAAGTFSPVTTALGVAALTLVLLFQRFVRRVPGAIVALIIGTLVVVLFNLPVETIGSRFGGVPSGLPEFRVPAFRPDLVINLVSPALTVALLGAIESLLSAVVSDRMSGDRHNPNVELVAQGVANIASPLFGGLPATGAIARTATNVRSGAKTPVAGMVHALTLLLVLLFAAPLASYVPLAVLAAILFVVSWNMGEWREIPEILKPTKADIAVWLVTVTLTVVADLTIAVEVGMVLAALLFIGRVADTTTVEMVTDKYVKDGRVHVLQGKDIPPYVAIFRIHGPFLFGSTDKLDRVTARIPQLPHIVVLRLRNMTALDATGLKAIEDLADRLHASGRVLLLCGARSQPAKVMAGAEFHAHVGRENVLPHVDAALDRARVLHLQRAAETAGSSKAS